MMPTFKTTVTIYRLIIISFMLEVTAGGISSRNGLIAQTTPAGRANRPETTGESPATTIPANDLDPAVRQSLLADLRNPEPVTRQLAVNVLARLGGREDRQIQLLLDDPSPLVRKAVLEYFASHPSRHPFLKIWNRWRQLLGNWPVRPAPDPDSETVFTVDRMMDYFNGLSRAGWFKEYRAAFCDDLTMIRKWPETLRAGQRRTGTYLSLSRKAGFLLVQAGNLTAADAGFTSEEYVRWLQEKNPAALPEPVFESREQALSAFHQTSADEADGSSWWDAWQWLRLHPAPETTGIILVWLSKTMDRAAGNELPRLLARRWESVVAYLRETGSPDDAAGIMALWSQCQTANLAYDLAWLAGRLGGPAALTGHLQSSEAWRQEQIALLLFGMSEKLDFDTIGKILAVKKLCRMQSLWLLELALEKCEDGLERMVELLSRYQVKASPELLFELRFSPAGWVRDQTVRILTEGPEEDVLRLIGLLPDFPLPDKTDFLEKELRSSGARAAAAMAALCRLAPEKAAIWLREPEYLSNWRLINTAGAAALDTLLTCPPPPAFSRLWLRRITGQEEQTAMHSWLTRLAEARDSRAIPLAQLAIREGQDPGLRALSVRYLGLTGGTSIADTVRLALADPDLKVRREAAEAIGMVGESGDCQRLEPLLHHEATALSAAISLSQLLDRASPEDNAGCLKTELAALLPWAITRSSGAGTVLDRLVLPAEAFLPLLGFMLATPPGPDTPALANVLARHSRPRLLQALQAALSFGRDSEQARAAYLLSLPGLRESSSVQPLMEALNQTSDEIRRAAATTLGILGDRRAVPALRKCLLNPDIDGELRECIVETLLILVPGEILTGPEAILVMDERHLLPALYCLGKSNPASPAERLALWKMHCLYDDAAWIQQAMVDGTLLRSGEPEAKIALTDLLSMAPAWQEDEEAILRAFLALYPFGNLPDGGEKTFRLGLSAPRREARTIAAIRLALLGDQSAARVLMEQAGHDHLRQETGRFLSAFEVLALGTMQLPGTAETLINILNQGEVQKNWNWLAGAAAMTLGVLGDQRALPALRRARLSRDPLLAFYAATALTRLADEDCVLSLLRSRHPELILAGIHASGRFAGEPVRDALAALLRHPDFLVRGSALFALGNRFPSGEIPEPLRPELDRLASRDPSERVRAEARALLAATGKPSRWKESYFASGLLLDLARREETGLDSFFPLVRLQEAGCAGAGDPACNLAARLRQTVAGQYSLFFFPDTLSAGVQEKKLTELLPGLFALHLLIETGVPDSFELFRDWLQAHPPGGSWLDEAVSGAAGILGGNLGDPRSRPLLEARRSQSREWLARGLIDSGLRRINEASR